MHTLFSRTTWLPALLTFALTIALLAAMPARAEPVPNTVRIATVAYTINGKTTYMGSSALVEEGGLEAELNKRGIKLEWVPAATAMVGPIINEAFASGTIDFASYGDLPPIILNGAKPRVQLVAPWGRNGNSYLVVPVNSKATSIRDLKGKRIALHRGRPWEIPFANLLEQNGLKLSDVKIVNVNPQVGAAALASGSVDAFYTLNDAYNLVDKRVGKIIWSTKNAPPDWKLMGGLWARNAFVEQYPQLTQQIVNAYVKINHWTAQEANRDKYITLYASQVQPESVIRRDYEEDSVSWKDRWSPLYDDALFEHYRRAASYAKQTGLIRKDIELQQLLNPRFVTQALKQLQIEHYWAASSLPEKK